MYKQKFVHLKNVRGAAKTTHLAKCWLHKQEVNLHSQHPCENPGAVVACLVFSTGRGGTGWEGPRGLLASQFSLIGEHQGQ